MRWEEAEGTRITREASEEGKEMGVVDREDGTETALGLPTRRRSGMSRREGERIWFRVC